VDDRDGMQLSAEDATPAHYIPHPALLPFPLVHHLLGSTFFRGAAATDGLVAALALYAEKAAAPGAAARVPGAAQFRVRCVTSGAHMEPLG
jgi:hypothetical protein